MKLYTKAAAAVSTLLLVGGLAACGGGADRPSQDELADALKSEEGVFGSSVASAPDDMLDCMAGVFVDSDISDDALNAIVEGDMDYDASDEDEQAVQDVMSEMTSECTPDMDDLEVPEAE